MERRGKVRAYGPYKHGNKWRVHFVDRSGGTRTTTYEVFDSRADAFRCKDAATEECEGISVSKAIKAFIDVKRAQGRAELTLVAYESRLNLLLAQHMARPLRSIVHRGPELYEAVIPGHSPDYHQNVLAVGRIWAKWCVKRNLLRANPFTEVDPVGRKTYGADKARLSTDESRRLEAWCIAHPDDQGAVLALGYLYLGTRCTELACRDVRDIDDAGRVLVVGKTKTPSGRRKLAIPDALREMLWAWCKDKPGDAPIFTDARGDRMGRNAARLRVQQACREAGVTVVPPQALRRTQASLATEAGETALAVARHLGHSAGAVPKVTGRAYIDRDVAVAAQGERALRVLHGGGSWKAPWNPGQSVTDSSDEKPPEK